MRFLKESVRKRSARTVCSPSLLSLLCSALLGLAESASKRALRVYNCVYVYVSQSGSSVQVLFASSLLFLALALIRLPFCGSQSS